MSIENGKGKEGENAAAKYLQSKNYIILKRNWRGQHKEIDIICLDQDTLVFVEVKNRKVWGNIDIREIIPHHKIRNIIMGAEYYILENNPQKNIRFDLIFINTDLKPIKPYHIKDAFNALDF
ncbi:YraN family protein [Halosquirtibacter laminarini]|uniref:YraN family protein n=1 Tax=Halosquirtibacter laminarini TaxID=3374600 RepID=A0AC61NEY7_9BACT|nr:YraN family protein [Prolixibacteraceae bacterium]